MVANRENGHVLDFQTINPDLTPLTDACAYETVVHGTYLRFWEQIRRSGGLSRMRRNHIHFAAGLPGEDGVISGMRQDCNVLIYVDVEKAQAGEQ